MSKILTMAEVKSRSIEDLLREIDATQMPVRVRLEGGHEVDIKPAPKLKPLLTNSGFVPDGWKDAIYEPKHGS